MLTLPRSVRLFVCTQPTDNPLLLAAGFDKTDVRIPWLGHKRLSLVFG